MNLPKVKEKRKILRNHSTSAEAVLWNALKNKQIDGLKFRRQHSTGPYIIDFYCHELGLAIELDGEVHGNPNAEGYDNARTARLSEVAGISVLRFENKEVFCNQELIIASIRESVRKKGL